MTGVARRNVTVGEQSEAAHARAEKIKLNVRKMRTLWVELAEDLHTFNELEQWRDLGYHSFEEWLKEPEIDLSRRTVYYLLEVWRELVIEQGIKPKELEKVGISKVQEILPAVRRGQVSPEEALADAGTLTRGDLRERYRQPTTNGGIPSGPDSSTSYEATSEPEFAICPHCGSRYRVKS